MLDLKIFFWNLGSRPCVHALRRVVGSHAPEIIVLSESPGSELDILGEINSAGATIYNLTINRSERLQFFVAFSPSRFEPMHDGPGIAVRRIDTILGGKLLLVALHLPSKLRLDESDQASLATRVGLTIRQMEARAGHARTIVIGDFNMNPFEHGIVGSEGFHAVSTRTVASRGGRTVMGERRQFFYNPMWSFLGDDSPGPPGTYYYAGSSPISYFWHTYDQVLLRPALAECYRPGDVTILDAAGDVPLLGSSGVPSGEVSDHLPILATIRFPETADAAT